MTPAWIFDPTPASGARDGGDVAEHAFTPSIDALVRETLQNASDQRVDPNTRVEVTMRIVTLDADALDALGRTELLPHLEAAAAARNGRFTRAVSALESGTMQALIIEDRHTTGLNGPEVGDGNFGALCRDKLFSNKSDNRAGGSYGLGKAVLWRFSQASTVAFCSWLSEPTDEQTSPRFIARCTLPWHETADGDAWSGGGWLGAPVTVGHGKRAESLWAADAEAMVDALGVTRPAPGVTGTSIVVLGFEDPTDDDATTAQLGEALLVAAHASFWPAMADGRLAVRVFVDDDEVELDSTTADKQLVCARVGRELLQAYRDRTDGDELNGPGDVIVVPIETTVPARRDGLSHRATCHVDLVLRLVDDKAPCRGEATVFRGPGMRIERLRPGALSLSARPWQALVVAGTARRDADPSDPILEDFLRESEPPAHDRWTVTARLRETYARGYKKALDTLRDGISNAIKRGVAATQVDGDEGPNALAKLFPVPGGGGGGRGPSVFHFADLTAHVQGAAWHARGTVRPNVPLRMGWSVRVAVQLKEDGGRGAGLPVATGTSTDGVYAVDEGCLVIEADPGVEALNFELTTDTTVDGERVSEATIDLVVTGVAR